MCCEYNKCQMKLMFLWNPNLKLHNPTVIIMQITWMQYLPEVNGFEDIRTVWIFNRYWQTKSGPSKKSSKKPSKRSSKKHHDDRHKIRHKNHKNCHQTCQKISIPQGTNFFSLECRNSYLFWILGAPLALQGGSELKKAWNSAIQLAILFK